MRILIVDDDELIRRSVARTLRHDHEVEVASRCDEARAILAARAFDFVLTDLHLPDGLGTELAAWVLDRADPPAVALMSGSADPTDIDLPLLEKPFSLAALRAFLAASL